MQFIVISHQLLECLWALLLGAVFGLLYDVLRFVRSFVRLSFGELLLLNITDILYLLFCSASYCVFLYSASNGRFRSFTFISLVAGFALYMLLPGRFINRILNVVSRSLRLMFKWLTYPLRVLFDVVKKGIVNLVFCIKRRISIRKTERIKKQLRLDVKI